MLITELKAKETIESLASGKVFIINCHGCREIRFQFGKIGGGQHRIGHTGTGFGENTVGHAVFVHFHLFFFSIVNEPVDCPCHRPVFNEH